MEAMCVPVEVEALVTTTEDPLENVPDQSLVRSSIDSQGAYGSEVTVGDIDKKGLNEASWDKESWTKTAQELKSEKLKTVREEDSYVWSDDEEYVRDGPPEGNTHEDTLVGVAGSTVASSGDDGQSESTILARGEVDSSQPAAAPAKLKRIRPSRKTFTVAASAKTGTGFDDFLETLESALSLLLKPISVFIPVSVVV